MQRVNLNLVRIVGNIYIYMISAQFLSIGGIHDVEKLVLVDGVEHLAILSAIVRDQLHFGSFREINRHLHLRRLGNKTVGETELAAARREEHHGQQPYEDILDSHGLKQLHLHTISSSWRIVIRILTIVNMTIIICNILIISVFYNYLIII